MIKTLSFAALCVLTLATMTNSQASALATCTHSAHVLACSDADGNAYSVAIDGDTTYLRGFEVIGRRRWAQTSSHYGSLVFSTGLSSDGEAWVGYSRRVGWTTINHFASSSGDTHKFTCNRMGGCQ